MGCFVLSPSSPSPSPPHAFQYASSSSSAPTPCRLRTRRGGAFIVASAASPLDGGPSPSAAAADAYVLARRVVLLGASAIPFVSLREAAAAPTPVDLVKEAKNAPQFQGTKGIAKPDNSHPEGTQVETTTEARQSSLQSVQQQPSENPLVGFLGTVGVAASGVLGGLYGTSLQEKKALQSIISSTESKLVENEAALSLMRENYEKRLLEQQAAQKKQSMKFQEQEVSLSGQLASATKTLTSLSEESRKEKKLAEKLRDEIQRLESSITKAGIDKDVLETNLEEKLGEINALHEKISLLSQEIDEKEKHIRELSASLSLKEVDYRELTSFTNESKRSLELANSRVQQLEEELNTTKNALTSKISSIDSLNAKLETLNSEKEEADKKNNDLIQEYTDLKAASETRANHDSKLLSERDDEIKQLEEKLSVALTDSSKDQETIVELNKELDATKMMLENELRAMEDLKSKDLII